MIKYIPKNTHDIKIGSTIKGQEFTSNMILANGLTNKGWWCQYGVRIMHAPKGFDIDTVYEVWDDNGKSVHPLATAGGTIRFNGKVYICDKFDVTLKISEDLVIGTAEDINTGAYAEFKAFSKGNIFVGTTDSNVNGFSTSIFRELWVDSAFDTKTLAPQIIRVSSPMLEDDYNNLMKISRETYSNPNDMGKPKHSTHYSFENRMVLGAQYLLTPMSTDPMIKYMRVGSTANNFYTAGEAEGK